MLIKKSDLLNLFESEISTCEFFLLSKDVLTEDFIEHELNLLKYFSFLHEFFVDYCDKNNIKEFDF